MKNNCENRLKLRMADENGRARIAELMALFNYLLLQGSRGDSVVDASASFKSIPPRPLEDGDV
jgi:hypothetical protein